jgi:hypothetical protein
MKGIESILRDSQIFDTANARRVKGQTTTGRSRGTDR